MADNGKKKVRPVNDMNAGFEAFIAVTAWRLEDSTLSLSIRTSAGRDARLAFRAVASGTWRMTVRPSSAPAPAPTAMVIPTGATPAPLTAKEKNGRLLVSGPELGLEIGLDPWGLRFIDGHGRAILTDNPADVDGLGRPAVRPLGFVPGRGGAASISASFHLAPDERLYGLGEKFTRLDKAGQRIVSWTRDALGSTSERSHKNVPFLWSSRGFGLFLDTGARIAWDLGPTSLQSWAFEAEIPALDIYIFHGPRPDRILAAFTALTGRAPAPPKWSFGLWLSSGGTYRDQASIEALLDGVGKHRLPADVIHIDPWWMRWRSYCDFEWDRRAFPHPGRLIRRIHELGLKLCLWEHPYISVESDLYELGQAKGYFIRRPDGGVYIIDYGLSLAPRPDGRARLAGPKETWNAPVAVIDLTNPAARAWFQDLHRPLLRAGVDVFKTDFGEDIPEDARFHDGQTGATMHNLYPLIYNAAVFEVTAEEKGRGLVWSRSGTAGSQRFPVAWSGDPASDFDSLAATVRGGLSAGMSGIPFWSHDIGGYRGTPDPELYVRWAQFGLFSSHSRMHGDSPREPWKFGKETLAIVRKFIGLRYRLFPYIQSTALEARDTGMPVIRALPLAFPDDRSTAAWDYEYMFGPWFLVAPIIRRKDELGHSKGDPAGPPRYPVYLPPGEWVDYWTGRMHRGPAVIDAAAPLDILPLFVRAGAIVPMARAGRRIPGGRVDPLEVELYPIGPSSYALLEEEGRTDFRLEGGRKGHVLEWSGSFPRRFGIRAGRGRKITRAFLEDGKKRIPLSVDTGRSGVAQVWIPPSRSEKGRVRFSVSPEDPIVI